MEKGMESQPWARECPLCDSVGCELRKALWTVAEFGRLLVEHCDDQENISFPQSGTLQSPELLPQN